MVLTVSVSNSRPSIINDRNRNHVEIRIIISDSFQFSVFLGLIFVCELAGGIAAYVLRGEVEGIVNENMKTSLKLFNESGHGGVTDTWNIMQHDVSFH